VEKDHGRIETRRYYQSDHLEWFADQAKWEGLTSVGMVESILEHPAKERGKWHFGIEDEKGEKRGVFLRHWKRRVVASS